MIRKGLSLAAVTLAILPATALAGPGFVSGAGKLPMDTNNFFGLTATNVPAPVGLFNVTSGNTLGATRFSGTLRCLNVEGNKAVGVFQFLGAPVSANQGRFSGVVLFVEDNSFNPISPSDRQRNFRLTQAQLDSGAFMCQDVNPPVMRPLQTIDEGDIAVFDAG